MSDRFVNLFQAFHDLLFVFRTDGVLEDYLTTHRKEELLVPRQEFIGKHFTNIFPNRINEQLSSSFMQLEQGKGNCKFDYYLENKGHRNWYSAVITKFNDGGDTKYLGAVRNITERKNKELLFKGVLNTSPAGIILFRSLRDQNGSISNFKITHTNKVVERITGRNEQQLSGLKLSHVVSEKDKTFLLKRFKKVVETGEPVDFDYYFENEEGASGWYFCKLAKFNDGLVTSFLDITKRKQTEQKLRTANEELKDINRQKDKLFSVISHDLKNAVAGTTGTLGMILEDFEEISKEELHDYLELLNQRSNDVSDLLEDLLLWSKNQFQEVKANCEITELSPLLAKVNDVVSAQAEDKDIDITYCIPQDLTVFADADMLKTILRNLITNAIKFSHPGGEVKVCAENSEQGTTILIKDQGVGIKKEDMNFILDKKTAFTTKGTQDEKGSGLGLDLCIDFIEKQNGTLQLESAPGKGSTFYFTLPHS